VYSLQLRCPASEVDLVSGELWELGTEGIREVDYGEDVLLIATFAKHTSGAELHRFAAFSPEWEREEATDWVEHTHQWWPARAIANRIFLAPLWSHDETPPGRVRVVHNPGLASGTGEHPCTQLALAALERNITPGDRALDIGTGSGILAIAALRLGARVAVGVDTDLAALPTARANFELNEFAPTLIAGSAACLHDACSDVTVANISGTVLLAIFDDLLRVTSAAGRLILTGFTESETRTFAGLLRNPELTVMNEWNCVSGHVL